MNKPLGSVQGHMGWVDVLRIAACVMVVLSHSCDQFVAQYDADRAAFLTGMSIGSLVRPCVPLFAMITGVLLLGSADGMTAFCRKRLGRIALPLAFWSLALPAAFYAYLNLVNPATLNPAIAGEHTAAGTLHKMWSWVLNFNFDTTPLWYLYMLAGLYIIMPVFGAWLRQATKKDMQLFLCAWALSLLLPAAEMLAPLLGYEGNYGNTGLLGVCDWNRFGTLYYASGFIGYAVLGHYLNRFPPDWSRARTLGLMCPVFIAGYALTLWGYAAVQEHFPQNYAFLEAVWSFCGLNVCMMTVPLFVIIRRAAPASRRWLSKLSSLTFGIYLCHFIVVQIAYDIFAGPGVPYIVSILCMAASSFAVSAALTAVLKRFGPTAKLVS